MKLVYTDLLINKLIMNFGGHELTYNYQQSGIVILPVPYDETSTWMKGADKGPEAIMEASLNLEFYDIETNSEAHKYGIHTIEPLLEKETLKAWFLQFITR